MARYKVGFLPGDGIGREVLECTRPVLAAVGFDAEYIECDIGWHFWRTEGNPLPDRTVRMLEDTDCALLGAVTSKPDPEAQRELSPALRKKGVRYSSAVLRLRKLFDLYVNYRPCRSFSGNPNNYRDGIDIDIFRENTEGLYSGFEYDRAPPEFRAVAGMERLPPGAAVTVRTITRRASERIVQAAFVHARKTGRKLVTAVHKANVMRSTCGLFLRSARNVARRFPDVRFEEMHIDACAMHLLRDPEHFEVVVTTNLFGDILSDLGAQLTGGMGFAPSGNMGDTYAIFEPVHGSAPDIAGTGKANPVAAMLSAGMMLGWLGEKKKARELENAVAAGIARGKVRTPDTGGRNSTAELARAIVGHLKK